MSVVDGWADGRGEREKRMRGREGGRGMRRQLELDEVGGERGDARALL